MRAREWFLCPIFVALVLSVAIAQKSDSKAQQTEVQPSSQKVAKPSANAHVVLAQQQATGEDTTVKTSSTDQLATKPSTSETPSAIAPASSGVSSDGDGEDADTAKPRFALPVILNPDSPELDRPVHREDIPPVPNDYVIGEEDVLTITVWKEHDLSSTIVVRPDGIITVPLVGEIHVVGLKPSQLQDLLSEKLKPFVNVPQVSVAVNQINSRKVYLIGQVAKEGMFPINNSATVLQVLAGAGGLRDFAKRKKIYILRKQGSEEIRFPFDYDAAIRGRNAEQNIRLQPGDTIVVP